MKNVSFFAFLYFIQGSCLAYFMNFQKPMLGEKGISHAHIGLLTTILLMPFVIKIFFGWLADRYAIGKMGHRKPYMLIGLMLASVGFLSAAFVNIEEKYFYFATMMVIASLGMSLYDSAADGMALDLEGTTDGYAKVQSGMVAGKSLGMVLFAWTIGRLASEHGYKIVFLGLSLLCLLPIPWVLTFKNKTKIQAKEKKSVFKISSLPLMFVLYSIVYAIASYGIDGILSLYITEHMGAGTDALGAFGSVKGIGSIFGALVFGLISTKIGFNKVQHIGLIAIALCAIYLLSNDYLANLSLIGLALVWGVVWSFQESIFVTQAMKLSDNGSPAMVFAIYMALSNVGTALGDGVATALVTPLGFSQVFLVLSAVAIIGFLIGFRTKV